MVPVLQVIIALGKQLSLSQQMASLAIFALLAPIVVTTAHYQLLLGQPNASVDDKKPV